MWKQVEDGFWKQNRESKVDTVTETVAAIVERVKNEGDAALKDLTKQFDKVELSSVAVSRDEIDAAYDKVDAVLVEALEDAADRIQRFHEKQVPPGLWLTEMEPGMTLGVKTTPLLRVGCYIPGGRASYPSTALMCVIPAKVAGVEEVVCCTPAPVNPLTLVALDIAGCDEIYQVGGAQAIAAMALGTESVEPVQKIVGPGNVFVTAAKMMLRNKVEIDFPAGPSEIGIIADSTGDAEFIASDIIAQCEHDPSSASILVTDDPDLAARVGSEVERQTADAPRKAIIEASLGNSGYMLADTLDEAIALMNRVAPEHLSIQTADPLDTLSKVKNAGSIFVGPYTPVAAGDYASGTNHVLPTAGHAMTASGLNVAHFCKTSTVQILTPEGLGELAPVIEELSTAEGLHAHCASVRVRCERQ